MAINVGAFVEGAGAQAPAAGRQQLQTESRQGRWLYELEHAMLLQSGKKPAQEDAGARKTVDAGANADTDDPLRQRQHRGDDDMAADPVAAPALAGGLGAVADGAVAGARTVPLSNATSAAVDAGRATPSAGPAVVASAAPSGMALPVALLGAGAPPASLVLGAYGAAVASRVLAPGPSAGTPGKTAVAPSPGLTMAGADAPAPPALPREADAETAAEPADVERDGADTAAPNGDDYADRLLHVYRDAEGVQAWIRDAAIGQAQLPGLAQAMAGELGGAQLAALTVNGKRLALPAAGAGKRAPDEFLSDDTAAGRLDRPASRRDTNTNANANGAA